MFHVWCLKAARIRLEKMITVCTVNSFEDTSNFWKNCHDKPSLGLIYMYMYVCMYIYIYIYIYIFRTLDLPVWFSLFQTALPSHFKPPSTEVSVTALMVIVGVVMATVVFLVFVARWFGKFAFM